MARGRVIWNTLGSSRRFAALGRVLNGLGEFAQSLYPLLVTHADDYGREEGDAFTVKTRVFPTSPRTEQEFEDALEGMVRVNLIHRYAIGGRHVIQIVDYKQGLRRYEPSEFPEPDSPCIAPLQARRAADTERSDSDSDTKRNESARGAGDGGFEEFWREYPRKVGKDAARREWLKRSPNPALRAEIMAALERHKASPQWQKEGGQFIPHPRTWLHHGRWQDELDPQGFTAADADAQASPRATEDWFEECRRIHNGECGLSQHRHDQRKRLDVEKGIHL
jgi:hypothetical protein